MYQEKMCDGTHCHVMCWSSHSDEYYEFVRFLLRRCLAQRPSIPCGVHSRQ